jgi:hypothetical protein
LFNIICRRTSKLSTSSNIQTPCFCFSAEEEESDSDDDEKDEVEDAVDAGEKIAPKVDEKVLKLKAQLQSIKNNDQSERFFKKILIKSFPNLKQVF